MIYNSPVNSSVNNSQQSFGFKILVKEAGKVLNMAESNTFRNVEVADIIKLQEKADKYLPNETVILESRKNNPMPFESFDVDVFCGEKKIENLPSYYPREIMAFLKRAVNPHTGVHSRIFYDGEKSPETLARLVKFKDSIYKPKKNSNI